MKFGKQEINISLAGEFKQEDFAYHHHDQSCTGKWGIMVQNNVPFPIPGLGTTLFPMAVFVVCPSCKAAYFLPGLQDFVEHSIASHLVASERLLMPKEIKFLRLMFGLTQQQVVDQIEMESVSYYSKCETGKPGFALGPDKQVRLKLLYATNLGLSSPEEYKKISLTSSKREPSEPSAILDLQGRLKPGIENLAEEFRSKFDLKDLPPIKHA